MKHHIYCPTLTSLIAIEPSWKIEITCSSTTHHRQRDKSWVLRFTGSFNTAYCFQTIAYCCIHCFIWKLRSVSYTREIFICGNPGQIMGVTLHWQFQHSLLFSNNSLLLYSLFYMKIEICFLYKGVSWTNHGCYASLAVFFYHIPLSCSRRCMRRNCLFRIPPGGSLIYTRSSKVVI